MIEYYVVVIHGSLEMKPISFSKGVFLSYPTSGEIEEIIRYYNEEYEPPSGMTFKVNYATVEKRYTME